MCRAAANNSAHISTNSLMTFPATNLVTVLPVTLVTPALAAAVTALCTFPPSTVSLWTGSSTRHSHKALSTTDREYCGSAVQCHAAYSCFCMAKGCIPHTTLAPQISMTCRKVLKSNLCNTGEKNSGVVIH